MIKVNLKRQAGFSMIEVLISMLVLAIGILGMISLQMNGKRTNFEAVQRTTAAQLAEDIINRMRANSEAVYLNLYDTSDLGGESQGASSPTPNCSSADCTNSQLAAYDLWEWERKIDGATVQVGGNNVAGLVDPTGCIAVSDGYVEVAVVWRGTVELNQANIELKNGVLTGISSCGDGNYGDDDELRQSLLMRTYISE